MKEPGKLWNGMDKISDRYLDEALEYKKRPSSWKTLAALAACMCLVLGGGFFAWKMALGKDGKAGGEQQGQQDADSLQAEEVWYVDAHTLLAGKEGDIPMEKSNNDKESMGNGALDAEGDAKETENKPYVTIKWAYQSFGVEEISRATVREINKKLKEDGYSFGIQFLAIETTDGTDSDDRSYQEKLFQSGADIAFTGFYSRGEHYVEGAIRAGKYEPLDAYLKNSVYYDQIPEVLWSCASYQNKIYFFPNEVAQDAGLTLYLRKSSFTKEEADAFYGDLFSLEQYFAEGKKLLSSCSDYQFAETFGYSYYMGVLLTEDGEVVNPLEEENCVRWMRILNEYQEQVVQSNVSDWDFALSRSFPGTNIGDGNHPEDFYTYTWKGYAVPRFNCQTGILAASPNKQEAFQFLELLHTDASYAKLLLYGKEALEQGGDLRCSYLRQLISGLDTGLVTKRKPGDMLRCFATTEEKKKYYAEWILPSPALSLKYPEVCDAMLFAEEYYARLLYTIDFDALLKKASEKTREPMQKVKKGIR
ncbi:MAG: hypothetical protein E7295_11665 [Lachnospiraceae bacterium]|nr:hypothetical protein [Lachnospiraceae bacterium]